MSAQLNAAVRRVVPWLVALVAELPVPLVCVRWGLLLDDRRENRRNSWGRLRGPGESARYDAVRRFVEAYGSEGFVLDVGCSQGILQEGLTYRRYLGVDRSAGAIGLARSRRDDRTDFEVADASEFRTDERPDVVVLNEVLYYLPEPVRTVEHYARLVEEDGVVVVSVYAHAWSTRRLLRQIHARLDVVRSTSVQSGEVAWIVAAFRGRGPVRPG